MSLNLVFVFDSWEMMRISRFLVVGPLMSKQVRLHGVAKGPEDVQGIVEGSLHLVMVSPESWKTVHLY